MSYTPETLLRLMEGMPKAETYGPMDDSFEAARTRGFNACRAEVLKIIEGENDR